MPTIDFQGIPNGVTNEQLADIVARFIKEIQWLSNNMDSKNIRNIAGFDVDDFTLKHKSGIVGISGADQNNPIAIRYWAGNANPAIAPFRVQQNGYTVLTGALIQSKDGAYPRIVIDPASNVFRIDQSSTSSMIFNPSYLGTTPVINFHYGSIDGYLGYFSALGKLVMSSPDGVDIELSNGGTSGDISLRPVDNLNVPDWSEIINDTTSQTLQAAFDGKADVFSGYTGSVTVVTSVDFGGSTTTTSTLNFTNGVLTSVT